MTMSGGAVSFSEAINMIKSSLDIVEVISRHITLKKTGRNYLGLCPFHAEKTPSFNVNREKGLFKCFGCGEGGDALDFLMKRENRGFSDIIRDLASDMGLSLQESTQSVEEKALTQKIYDINAEALQWYHQNLVQQELGHEALSYLYQREIMMETIAMFQIGYAPSGWDRLCRHFKNDDLLLTAGLANRKENQQDQRLYDRFRNRVILPIHDESGRIVGFGGRALQEEDKPKYLNTPETPVYFKNKILYGLHQAKGAIRESRFAIVMEGYFDVISAHMSGISQAVGTCGTAMSESHLKLLTRFGAETIFLAFDSDEPGIKAALHAISLIEHYISSVSLAVKVVLIPQGKDPDEYIRKHKTSERPHTFLSLLDSAKPYLTFQCDTAIRPFNLKTPEGRIGAVGALIPCLVKIRQPVLLSEYIKIYAETLHISEETLKLEIKHALRQNSPSVYRSERFSPSASSPFFSNSPQNFSESAILRYGRTSYNKNPLRKKRQVLPPENMSELRKPLLSKDIAAERALLKLLFLNSESYRIMLSHLQTMQFDDPRHHSLWDAVLKVAQEMTLKTDNFPVESLIRKLNDQFENQPEMRLLLSELALTSDDFGLTQLSTTLLKEKLSRIVAGIEQEIGRYRSFQHLQALNRKAKLLESLAKDTQDNPELPVLELQYQLRDKISQRLSPEET